MKRSNFLENRPLPDESVSVSDALGRILAEDIVADCDLPPFISAQMDGYALQAADAANTPARLRIVGNRPPARVGISWIKAAEAVRIMTGAPVRKGADAVQQVELTRKLSAATLSRFKPWTLADRCQARAEIKAGETVLRAGEDISATMVAVLASFGYAQVRVAGRPASGHHGDR